MPFSSDVDPAETRSALAAVVPRLTELIRTVEDPRAPAIGEWAVRDVAVHLAHVWETLPALGSGALDSPLAHLDDLAGLTASMVRDDPGHDLEVIAARIEAAASAYLGNPGGGPESRPWLVEGTELPTSAFTCHILSESLVHGHDIAHAEGRPWAISSHHAGLAIMGFIFPALSVLDPRAPVDQQRAAGVHACFDIRVRHAGRAYLSFDDGALTIEPPSARRVDCHISADAAALFLLIWSRGGQWPAILTGRMTGWGRRPWLGPRLAGMMRNP